MGRYLPTPRVRTWASQLSVRSLRPGRSPSLSLLGLARVITLFPDLPQDAVKMDGYTQQRYRAREANAANPLIVIDGSNLSDDLDIENSTSEIRGGLVIRSVADRAGIFIELAITSLPRRLTAPSSRLTLPALPAPLRRPAREYRRPASR